MMRSFNLDGFKVGYLSFIIPFLILLLKKDSKIVRAHAGKALAVNIVSSGVALIAALVSGLFLARHFLFHSALVQF